MRYQILADNIEILQAFSEESIRSLQNAEEQIRSGDMTFKAGTCLDEFFRQMHSIKGLSSFLGLARITRLSHQAELVIDILRNGDIQPEGKEIELLLTATAALAEMLVQLREACVDVPQGAGREIDIGCIQDIDGLIQAMELYIQAHPDTAVLPGRQVERVTPAERPQPINEQLALAADITGHAEKESVSFILTGVAVGLLEDYLLEANEHCSIITNQLLITLDSEPSNTNSLDDLFRRIHTLKGNTALLLSVPLDDALRSVLKEVLHILQNTESMLTQVRDAKRPISSAMINVCFEVMDALVAITAMLRKGVAVFDDGKLERLVAAMAGVPVSGSGSPLDPTTVAEGHVNTNRKSAVEKKTSKNTDVPMGSGGQSIRVSGEKVDRLMNVIGELSITKNVFIQIARKLAMEYNLPQLAREVKDAGQFVNRISAELEDAIMAMRMTEVRVAFQKFPRIIRDIALQTGKSISLIMEGEDTELDKNIIEQIGDPLLHLVRNSGDHGIETVEERRAAGKDPQGNVWLRAYNRGKHVIIEVEDDGRGMDPEQLKGKAVDKGFITQAEAREMSDEQAFQLIFLAGFSTAKNVTEISGRGVGMDVVRSNITDLQGTIKITSQLGKGSKITMQLPLTLMVSRGLVVEVGQEILVIPLDHVLETTKIATHMLAERRGRRIFYHRGEVLGVVSLAEILKMPRGQTPDDTPVVIMTDGQSKVGMIVDRLRNEQDILVKPLPEYLSGISGIGGATIMGDGKVALVLNPLELMQLVTK